MTATISPIWPRSPVPRALPLVKPPWSRVTAIDLQRGEILWQVALGDGPRDHPALAGLDLPALGTWPVSGLVPGWPLVTETLLFVLQARRSAGDGADRELFEGGTVRGDVGVLSAFDKTSGELLAEIELEKAPGGGPMTYIANGRQFIVLPIGQRNQEQEFIALAVGGAQ